MYHYVPKNKIKHTLCLNSMGSGYVAASFSSGKKTKGKILKEKCYYRKANGHPSFVYKLLFVFVNVCVCVCVGGGLVGGRVMVSLAEGSFFVQCCLSRKNST